MTHNGQSHVEVAHSLLADIPNGTHDMIHRAYMRWCRRNGIRLPLNSGQRKSANKAKRGAK